MSRLTEFSCCVILGHGARGAVGWGAVRMDGVEGAREHGVVARAGRRGGPRAMLDGETLGEQRRKVLEGLAADRSPQEIARDLGVSVKDVYWHIQEAKALFAMKHLPGLVAGYLAWRDGRRCDGE